MNDAFADLERFLEASAESTYVLRLYVVGSSPQSTRAVDNLKRLCEKYLPGRYELTVVDLYEQPEQAGEAQIIAAPTLVKSVPLPVRRLLGDLSDTNRVLVALDLPTD